MKLILHIAMFLGAGLLVGCTSMPPRPLPSPATTVGIDPSLKVRCAMLPQYSTNMPFTMGDLEKAMLQLQGIYNTCAIRNDCLIKAVNAGNDTKVCDKPKTPVTPATQLPASGSSK